LRVLGGVLVGLTENRAMRGEGPNLGPSDYEGTAMRMSVVCRLYS
jgi:hypothetical protein